ncbi:MAG: hypothetical protein AB2541_05800 [Candidatus Thiodiazotropha sp.]
MNTYSTSDMKETQSKDWKKKLYWALPLFFMIKGLLWLAIPLVSAVYVFK